MFSPLMSETVLIVWLRIRISSSGVMSGIIFLRALGSSTSLSMAGITMAGSNKSDSSDGDSFGTFSLLMCRCYTFDKLIAAIR